jgi:hypothetical protein
LTEKDNTVTRLLLDDRLAPATSEIGFLELPLERAVEGWHDWQAGILSPLGITLDRQVVCGSLEEVLERLLPLTSVDRRRFLFIPTEGPWTAFFDNGHQGTDAMAPMSFLAQQLKCRGLRVVAVPDADENGKEDRFGAAVLEIYGPQETDFLNYVRSIACVEDTAGWTFAEAGTAQPFEDQSLYAKRRTKDRFTLQALASYLDELGVRAFDDGYFRPQDGAVILEKTGTAPAGMREFTLAEARRR